MANVIQCVPDGNVCATLESFCQNEDSKCIFLEHGVHFQRGSGGGIGCRRYPEWELAIKHDGESMQVYKCPPCIKETVKENV